MKLEKICRLGKGDTKAVRVTASGVTRTFWVHSPRKAPSPEALRLMGALAKWHFPEKPTPSRHQVFAEIRAWLARDPKEVVRIGDRWSSASNRLYPIYGHLDGTPLTDSERESLPEPAYRW